ncbi:LysR family transcriptional regulator [Pseudomonas frederiksbergensis]|uniref:LysR family transcriptional regulator n=1 Tax=Pseudomonas frederiksbergensis TaxID=104087 RepID=A0A423KGC8_9PSED|nr:LysR family transcriptional regulator [Pseudomonas frederiksbergensis]RON51870.1 LysR family transcriptional regulator [Pseudomonas frederiksbergensis]
MDTLEAMAVFMRVVERGSFSAVAREIGLSQPTISKQIGALETRLGGRLFARSTRNLSLTDEGQRYYEHCRQILAAVDNAEQSFQTGRERVAGPLRIASSGSFGRIQIAPRLHGFLRQHPDVTIDLQLSDENVDLVSEGIDIAVRIGELKDSSLVARQIGLTRRRVFAAPAYLEQHGVPATPDDLTRHNCLVFNQLEHFDTWRLEHDGQWRSVQVKGNVRSNNSEAIRQMVLSGLGLSLSPSWLFREDLQAGRVLALLEGYTPSSLPIHAVFAPDRRQSARVRAFTDYLRDAFADDGDVGLG